MVSILELFMASNLLNPLQKKRKKVIMTPLSSINITESSFKSKLSLKRIKTLERLKEMCHLPLPAESNELELYMLVSNYPKRSHAFTTLAQTCLAFIPDKQKTISKALVPSIALWHHHIHGNERNFGYEESSLSI